MKLKLTILTVFAACSVGFGLWRSAPPALAGEPQVAAAVVSLAVVGEDSPYEFVGIKKCKKCHSANVKSWEDTAHAKALESLRPGNATEVKEKHGLDVSKDYSTDAACLKCHVTGYGKAGGYAVPDPEDKKAVRQAEALAGVGCEMCHGPGSGYIDLHEAIMKEKRMYKEEEMYGAGMVKVEESTCKACHNDDNPTKPAEAFDFEKMKEKGVHEHSELKQREK